MLLAFLLGVAAGAGGYWYYAEGLSPLERRHLRRSVTSLPERVTESVKEQVAEWKTDAIKEELARSGMVVREKARQAGAALSDAAANARVTATIKAKLVAEPGLSALSINVDTTDGLVTLSGTVPSHEHVAKAVKLALETDGVHKVVSTLQVKAGK